MTLLLGPPSCGKSTFLKVLAGRVDSMQKVGAVALLAKHETVALSNLSHCTYEARDEL